MERLFLLLSILGLICARADEPTLPGKGFQFSRYEQLWTKSPFAIATPTQAASAPADYLLVGVAQFDGVSYANLIDKKTQDHFLLASDKPVRGLSLVSVTSGRSGSSTTAIVRRDGETLSLTMEETPPTGQMSPPITNPSNLPRNQGNNPAAGLHPSGPPPVAIRPPIRTMPPSPSPGAASR